MTQRGQFRMAFDTGLTQAQLARRSFVGSGPFGFGNPRTVRPRLSTHEPGSNKHWSGTG
jgi:hypothetical protein